MKSIAGLIVAGLMLAGAHTLTAADTVPCNGQGKGYGGPPKSEQERAARQAECLEKNGVCPNGGPRQDCAGLGQGGQGKGQGQCNGLRNGTGPRNGQGNGKGPRYGQNR